MVRFVYIPYLGGNHMHQSRRTHNAHNETQRRLKKLAKKERVLTYPHYCVTHYDEGGNFLYFDLDYNFTGSNMAPLKIRFQGPKIQTEEDLENAKKHSFYARFNKSKSSYWGWAKKRLHRIWRRKSPEELTYTYKDAKGCSMFDLW